MDYRLESRPDAAAVAAIDQLMATAANAHFTQHPAWAGVPSGDGNGSWVFFHGMEDQRARFCALIRVRRTPVFGYCLADIFRGPAADTPPTLIAGMRALEERLAEMRLLAVRVDPFWSGAGSEEVRGGLAGLGYVPMDDQPWSARTLQINIDRDPEQLLLSFRKETRYDVRKALKLNLDVREDLDDAGLAEFEELYRRMTLTKGAHARPAGFFAALRDYCRAWPQRGFIISSWFGSELLGAIVIFTLGRRAIYGYGASSASHPGIPKTHLLHFMAMQHARRRGCNLYDMGGFGAGIGEGGPQERTPAQKINYFKSGFGGSETDFVTAHEKIIRPAAYRLVRAVHAAASLPSAALRTAARRRRNDAG